MDILSSTVICRGGIFLGEFCFILVNNTPITSSDVCSLLYCVWFVLAPVLVYVKIAQRCLTIVMFVEGFRVDHLSSAIYHVIQSDFELWILSIYRTLALRVYI